jgi:PII-like signaling protein
VVVDEPTHPKLFVPVTVYVVVAVGVAVTVAPVVADRPVAGDHVYVAAPVAVRAVDEPAHIATFVSAVTTGNGLTETVVVDEPTHPKLFVPVTVYVVVAVGAAVTLAPDVADRPVAGDHVYVAAPVAISAVDEPAHIATFVPAVTTGDGLTETVVVDEPTHPKLFVPVTVYVVVADGAAVTLAPDVADRPVAGDHVYVAAPVAISAVDEPAHIATFVPAVTTGNGLTVTVIVAGAVHPPLVVAVTVYVAVAVGAAVTVAPDVADRPVAGDHVYVAAPVAVKAADEPEHIATSVPALIVSAKGGMIVTVCALLQELASVMVQV